MSENYEKFIYRRSWTASVYIATTIDCGSVAVARTRASAFVPASEMVSIEFQSNQFATEDNKSDSFTSFLSDLDRGRTKNELVALSSRVTTWKLTCECPIEVVQIVYYSNDDRESKNGNSFQLPKGSVMGTLIVPINSRIVFGVRRDKSWVQNEK